MVGRYDRHGHSVVFNPLLMITTGIYFPDFFCLDLSLIRLILPRRAHDHFNLNPRQSHQSPKSFRIWSGHAARYYHMNSRPNPTFLSSPSFSRPGWVNHSRTEAGLRIYRRRNSRSIGIIISCYGRTLKVILTNKNVLCQSCLVLQVLNALIIIMSLIELV